MTKMRTLVHWTGVFSFVEKGYGYKFECNLASSPIMQKTKGYKKEGN